jgi:type IV pilus assembly protein PilN
LENTRDRLLSRKEVIESLQASRSLTVELLDKLAKTIPVGVTLATVRQQGKNLTLEGTSQSNARVSAYLQSLENMDLFVRPELQYVRAAKNPSSRTETYEFAIRVRLNNERKKDGDSDDEQVEAG